MVEGPLRASVGMLKRIPSGDLRMGSPFHPREHPSQTVFVSEFEIGHAPVTVQQYKAFIDDGGMLEARWWDGEAWEWRQGRGEGWGRENRVLPDRWFIQRRRAYHPVVGVTWWEAQAYCLWLSERSQQRVRLPTEQEWERAARGDDLRPYPWGEFFDAEVTNTIESDRRDTVPAGSLVQDISPYGVLGMGGNVQEWTLSDYHAQPDEVMPDGPLKVVRSGSWNDTAYAARTSYRRAYPPGYFFPFLGFRVVVTHR